MPRFLSANDIINRAAIEIGLTASADPVGSSDDTHVQFKNLLDSAGQELVNLHNWQGLRNRIDATISTASGNTTLGDGVVISDAGTYDLPDDFDHMIDQTGWDRSNNVAIGGPLSAQNWTYLEGRDLVSQSIYVSFRLVDFQLDLYPQPTPDNLRLTFEYISRYWVKSAQAAAGDQDTVALGSDVVLYDPLLIIKFLKLKYLQAKGLPAQDAALEFETMFESRVGKSEGAPIVSASNNSRGFPYLHPYYNTGDTGYGAP